ncbi:MAG: phosphate acyltransferase, partial [Sphingomonadales bacterium]
MTKTLTIALDAMGGDMGPDMVVEGLSLAQAQFPDFRFLLFGDEARVAPLVARYPRLGEACEIRHVEVEISADERPSQA